MTILIIIFIYGIAIGSFLNVLIDRLPNNESINGRSHCDYCKKKIAWYDLFPIISFFILGGKTRCCGKKLSFQYPLIEMLTGLSFLLIFNLKFLIFNQFLISNFKFQILNLLIMWGIVSCLIVIFVSDLKYHLISDYILLAFFICSLLLHIFNNQTVGQWSNYLISGLIVALPISLIYFLSKERAMGLGDVLLALNIGFLLGWQEGFIALYIAFITGAIFGIGLIILQRKKLKSRIAFGPFLVLGTVAMLLYGEKVLELIKRIYGF